MKKEKGEEKGKVSLSFGLSPQNKDEYNLDSVRYLA